MCNILSDNGINNSKQNNTGWSNIEFPVSYFGMGTNMVVPSCCGFTFSPDEAMASFTAGRYWNINKK